MDFHLLEGLPCDGCWPGMRTAAELGRVLEHVADRRTRRRGLERLAGALDPALAPSLRALLIGEDPEVRAAAVVALAAVGERSGNDDEAPQVRRAVREGLALLGDRAGLWAALDGLGVPERRRVVADLVWLGEADARPLARTLLDEAPGEDRDEHVGVVLLADALHQHGTAEDRAWMLGPGRDGLVWRRATEDLTYDERRTLEVERHGLDWPTPAPWRWTHAPTTPARGIAAFRPLRDGEEPEARAGGLPDWLGEPRWPLAPDGPPLVFLAQLPLLDGRRAHLFADLRDGADTFLHLGPATALVVEPGAPPHLETAPLREGPRLFEAAPKASATDRRRLRRPMVRAIDLVDRLEPPSFETEPLPEGRYPAFDQLGWNKVGGTPMWVQHPDERPAEGWRFAFQLHSGLLHHDLADGAVWYGLVTDDGRGSLGWQCG